MVSFGKQREWTLRQDDQGQRGIALVAVLWIVASLTVLVLSFNASVRSHLDVSNSELGLARANAVVGAAVRLVVLKLILTDKKQRWIGDGRTYKADIVGHGTAISFQDESGLIDLNHADEKLLSGLLLRHVDSRVAQQLAARIVDWRDPDQKTRRNGAEDQAYAAAGLSYGAGDRPFTGVIELQSVIGMTPVLAAKLADYVTIYNGTSKLNILMSPRTALEAIPDVDDGLVSDVLRGRRDSANPKTLLTSMQRWQKYVSIKGGRTFRIRVDVADPNLPPTAAQVTVLIQKGGKKPFYVLEWREMRPKAR